VGVPDRRDRLSLDLEASLGKTPAGDKIAGIMMVEDVGGSIKIDREIITSPMLPFTIAHEIGHWILHQAALRRRLQQARVRGEPPEGLITLRRDVGGTKDAQAGLEWQANRFATHLLLPADLVREEFRRRSARFHTAMQIALHSRRRF
jgi:Zn-dependent peptidase ImmA (M78 family)